MSDARTDFFGSASGAKTPPAPTRDDFFDGKVAAEKPKPTFVRGKGYMDAEAIRRGGFNPATGFGEAALQVGTGAGSAAAAGVIGGLNAAWNVSPAARIAHHFGLPEVDSADLIEGILQERTYQPRTASGQEVAGAVASPANPLNWPGVAGEAAGDFAIEHGAPAEVALALRMAPDALAAGLGARSAPRSLAVERPAFEAPRPQVPKTPQQILNESAAGQSMGAAGAAVDLQKLSPSLRSAVEKAVQETGGAVNPEVLTRQIQADSLRVPGKLSEGQALGDPRLISLERNARGTNEKYTQGFAEQDRVLKENLRVLRDEEGPDVFSTNAAEHGDTLIARYKAIDDAARAEITAKYKALEEANGGQLPIQGKSFVQTADAALAKKLKTRYLPAQVAGDLAEFREAGGMMTFEQFENLRTNLAAEARKAERAGDGNAAAAVRVVRDALESSEIAGLPSALKGLADDARAAAKARFDAIDADPAYKAAVNDSTPPDTFVQKFVINGARDNVAKLSAAMAGDAPAAQTVKVATIQHLQKSAGIDPAYNGNFSQAGYNKALTQLEPKLDSLLDPRTMEDVRNLGDYARYVQSQPAGSFVNNSNTFVAAAAEKSADVLEGAVNYAAKGLPIGTFGRKVIQKRKLDKAAEKTFAPGAGLTRLSDLTKLKEKP